MPVWSLCKPADDQCEIGVRKMQSCFAGTRENEIAPLVRYQGFAFLDLDSIVGILLLLCQAPDIVEAIARNAGSKSHLAGSAMRPICQGLDRFPKRAIPTYDVAAC